MPHLDANALSSDDQGGLDFLKSVLDVPAERAAPSWDRPAAFPGARTVAVRSVSKRKRGKAAVPEAA